MSEDRQNVTVTRDPAAGAVVVRVNGDTDHGSVPRLPEALGTWNGQAASRTVAEPSRPDFADSSVPHVLLVARRAHPVRDAPMVVAGPLGDSVRRLFDITGTARFLVRTDDVSTALHLPVRPGAR